jgi:hypothetical protein
MGLEAITRFGKARSGAFGWLRNRSAEKKRYELAPSQDRLPRPRTGPKLAHFNPAATPPLPIVFAAWIAIRIDPPSITRRFRGCATHGGKVAISMGYLECAPQYGAICAAALSPAAAQTPRHRLLWLIILSPA